MKLLCAASLALAFALTTASVKADDEFKYSPYYPMQVGATWSYKAGDSKFTLTVKDQRRVGAKRWWCAHVETSQEGKAVGSEDVSVQDDGVYRVASDDKPIEPAVLILKLPPASVAWTVGSRVESKGGGDKLALSGTYTEAEAATVSAGGTDYANAVVVSCQDLDAHGAKYSFKVYYVKDVGMVKQEITSGGLTTTIELEKDGYKAGSK